MATATLIATAHRVAVVMSANRSRQNPASRQPSTAPAVFAPYSSPIREIPSGVDSSHRDAAGSEAPISNVGGSRHSAAANARNRMAGMP